LLGFNLQEARHRTRSTTHLHLADDQKAIVDICKSYKFHLGARDVAARGGDEVRRQTDGRDGDAGEEVIASGSRSCWTMEDRALKAGKPPAILDLQFAICNLRDPGLWIPPAVSTELA
jgi:hypothetical protein